MVREAYVVIVKMAYKDCPIKSRPVGLFAPDDIIGLFISDRSTRHDVDIGATKVSLSVGGGRNVRIGSDIAMCRYIEEIRPILKAKYAANFELELQPANRPQVLF